MKKIFKNAKSDTRGATTIEFCLVIGLLAAIALPFASEVGTTVKKEFIRTAAHMPIAGCQVDSKGNLVTVAQH